MTWNRSWMRWPQSWHSLENTKTEAGRCAKKQESEVSPDNAERLRLPLLESP